MRENTTLLYTGLLNKKKAQTDMLEHFTTTVRLKRFYLVLTVKRLATRFATASDWADILKTKPGLY